MQTRNATETATASVKYRFAAAILCMLLVAGALFACGTKSPADTDAQTTVERETYLFHSVRLQIPNGLCVRSIGDDKVVIASLTPTAVPDTVTMEYTTAENAAADGLNEDSVIELYRDTLPGFRGLDLYREETENGIRRIRYELTYETDEGDTIHLTDCLFVIGDYVVTIVFTAYSEPFEREFSECADALRVVGH